MIRRYLPWLFLAAAVFSLVGLLMEKHPNGWFIASRVTHVLISLAYLIPHHRHW